MGLEIEFKCKDDYFALAMCKINAQTSALAKQLEEIIALLENGDCDMASIYDVLIKAVSDIGDS